MDDKEKASDVLRKIYSKIDAVVDQVSVKANVTCKKGCAYCCELLALATFSEGLLIAEEILKKPDWRSIAEKMAKQAKETCFDGISEGTYFSRRIRCALLSGDKLCTIYDIRPACCRCHVVVSDPELCNPDVVTNDRATVDLVQLEKMVWEFNAVVAAQVSLDPILTAPIPVMVLHTMLAISIDPEVRKVLMELTVDVPNPVDWMKKYAADLTGGKDAKVLSTIKIG